MVRIVFHSCDNVLKVVEQSVHFSNVGSEMSERSVVTNHIANMQRVTSQFFHIVAKVTVLRGVAVVVSEFSEQGLTVLYDSEGNPVQVPIVRSVGRTRNGRNYECGERGR